MHFSLTLSIVLALAQNPAPVSQGTNAQSRPQQKSGESWDVTSVLQIQVMLDRAGFSPGAIDGRMGANTKKALELFQKSGHQGVPTIDAITRYRITPQDAAGPFIERLPDDLMETAKLPGKVCGPYVPSRPACRKRNYLAFFCFCWPTRILKCACLDS